MGETAELRNPESGTFSFNDFISQGDNEATIRNLLRIMIPTVDMREFQRKYVFSSGKQTLQIGETLVLDWTVPDNEWWRPRTLLFTNKDNIARDLIVRFTIDPSGDNIYQACKVTVAAGSSQVIYGQDIDGGVNIPGEYVSVLPNIMRPADVMTAAMTGTVAILSEQSWTMIYELVPQPAVALVRGVDAAVTVT